LNPDFFDFDLFAVPEAQKLRDVVRGAGNQKVFVVFTGIDEEPALFPFLQKIFQATKIDIEQDTYYLPLTAEASFGLAAIPQAKESEIIIIFGFTPPQAGLHLQVPRYQITPFRGQKLLFADALPAIYQERQAGKKEMSGALWGAMKALFLN
jgi:hypothetical protein